MSQVELLSIIEAPDAPLDQRIVAARALGALGDPRTQGPHRIHVPSGSFLSGDPPRAVRLTAYAIDRYPVTVVAFARFIDAGGYANDCYWSDPGWQWRTAIGVEKPRFWGEPEWAEYLVPNHPVVGVSFYEAEAYAAFVGARLPTEHEWEKAARGTDARKYPWGDEWQDEACGSRGVGPRSTVPIGVFPKGASPFGVRDMVGCIWQWCSDPFRGWGAPGDEIDRDDAAALASPLRRTTCGGAWNTLKWSVTCSSRNGFPAGARFSNLGFRCAAD
jgi:formylglycine-generating enzyme required for sulfatase activity